MHYLGFNGVGGGGGNLKAQPPPPSSFMSFFVKEPTGTREQVISWQRAENTTAGKLATKTPALQHSKQKLRILPSAIGVYTLSIEAEAEAPFTAAGR